MKTPKPGVSLLPWLMAGALILVCGTWFLGGRVKSAFKDWRASHHAEAARQMVLAKNWPGAVGELSQAMQWQPKSVDTLRVLADYLDATRSDPGLLVQTLRNLEDLGRTLPDDGLKRSRALLMLGNSTAADEQFQKLPQGLQDSSDGLELKAALLRKRGEVREAVAVDRQAPSTPNNEPDNDLRKAFTESTGTLAAVQSAAVARLWDLAERPDLTGLQAGRYLSDREDLSLSALRKLLSLVEAHSERTVQDRLKIISKILAWDEGSREALLDAEVERFKGGGLEETVPLAQWLAGQRAHARIVQLWPMTVIMQSRDLFPIVAQSLAEEGRWKELKELLGKGKSLPVSKERAAIWQALVSENLDSNHEEARLQLDLAIHQGDKTGQTTIVLTASQLAEHLQMWDMAIEGYLLLTKSESAHELDMVQNCWRIAAKVNDSALALYLARRLAALSPTNAEFAQRLSYFRLLRGEEIETVTPLDAAKTASQGETEDVTTLIAALQAYRLGDMALASAVLERIAKPAELPVGQRAVCAGLLAVFGQTARAYQLAERTPMDLLTLEERVFLNRAL